MVTCSISMKTYLNTKINTVFNLIILFISFTGTRVFLVSFCRSKEKEEKRMNDKMKEKIKNMLLCVVFICFMVLWYKTYDPGRHSYQFWQDTALNVLDVLFH